MAEGGDPTDPTTEKTPLIPDTGDDDDDDDNLDWNTPIVLDPEDPEDPDRTQPFEPGAASTPAGGESIPMTERTSLPQESGPRTEETPDSIPTVSEVDFVDEEEHERIIARAKRFIQDKFPKVDFAELGPIGFGKRPENRFNFVKFGPRGGEVRIINKDNSDLLKSFVDNNKKALGKSAEELAAEKNQKEKDLRLKLLEEEKKLKEKEQQIVLEKQQRMCETSKDALSKLRQGERILKKNMAQPLSNKTK